MGLEYASEGILAHKRVICKTPARKNTVVTFHDFGLFNKAVVATTLGNVSISILTNNEGQNEQRTHFPKQECLSALCRASFVDVYLAYLKSYGHLKIVKCIGMY